MTVERVKPPPEALVTYWRGRLAGLAEEAGQWIVLSGGRTNALWQVPARGGDLVVKLYRAEGQTPIFANDPRAEAASLRALYGTGLAPEIHAAGETPVGSSIVYAHLPGRPWAMGDDVKPVAKALARLHDQPSPPGLPMKPVGVARLWADTAGLASALSRETADRLAPMPSDLPDPQPVRPLFIHGDPTAANTLVTPDGIAFIDWQCPGLGDPADDLAVFLSPAMQSVSGNPPLSRDDEERFLSAYAVAAPDGAETVARYLALAPLHRVRMAAYALWRAGRGDAGYAEAAEAEIDRIRAEAPARQG